ncbi:hypothetical protein [Kibdelosporangium philippinense]|uniref:hypothetical protein n=1 Tax=Kibdelosporangium philippinense TaxID=211113 RepID=UPI00361F4AF1
MKVTLTAFNAPNLPLATACCPHGAVACQGDRGHGSLRAVSPGKPGGHRLEHRPASLKLWHWRSTPLTRPSRTVAGVTGAGRRRRRPSRRGNASFGVTRTTAD